MQPRVELPQAVFIQAIDYASSGVQGHHHEDDQGHQEGVLWIKKGAVNLKVEGKAFEGDEISSKSNYM